MFNKYQPVIGLEVHVELKTKSKMFCQCSADYFGQKPNLHVCPACLGLPGALPVPNATAILWMQKIGAALNCELTTNSKFDRKHYSYPDLPKGYQISQYDEPFAINGKIKIKNKIFRIRRVHMEEDTAKLVHAKNGTYIDFNRSGVPLVEIVTEPDFDNADDVKAFLEELQVIVRYLDVSDADMEKGSMRLEPNISAMKIGLGTLPPYKVEVKNINSFRYVKNAIEYEVKRQIEILEKGETPAQETRGWDDKNSKTYSQRSKEEAQDYRYFPEPDIPPFVFAKKYLEEITKTLPELPQEKVQRYVKDLKIKETDAFILTRDKKITKYYEDIILKIKNSHFVPLSGALRDKQNLNQVIANLIINKRISTDLKSDEFIEKIISLTVPIETNKKELDEVIEKIIKDNANVVEDYKKGKTNAIMFLVGQAMKELKGKAEAKEVINAIKNKIK